MVSSFFTASSEQFHRLIAAFARSGEMFASAMTFFGQHLSMHCIFAHNQQKRMLITDAFPGPHVDNDDEEMKRQASLRRTAAQNK